MISSLIFKNELLNVWEHCRTLENVETNCWVISTYKRLTKALIRLCVFAGWPEALLVAHTTLLEIHVVAQLSSQVLLIYLKYSPHIISTHKTHRKYLSSLTSAQHISQVFTSCHYYSLHIKITLHVTSVHFISYVLTKAYKYSQYIILLTYLSTLNISYNYIISQV